MSKIIYHGKNQRDNRNHNFYVEFTKNPNDLNRCVCNPFFFTTFNTQFIKVNCCACHSLQMLHRQKKSLSILFPFECIFFNDFSNVVLMKGDRLNWTELGHPMTLCRKSFIELIPKRSTIWKLNTLKYEFRLELTKRNCVLKQIHRCNVKVHLRYLYLSGKLCVQFMFTDAFLSMFRLNDVYI